MMPGVPVSDWCWKSELIVFLLCFFIGCFELRPMNKLGTRIAELGSITLFTPSYALAIILGAPTPWSIPWCIDPLLALQFCYSVRSADMVFLGSAWGREVASWCVSVAKHQISEACRLIRGNSQYKNKSGNKFAVRINGRAAKSLPLSWHVLAASTLQRSHFFVTEAELTYRRLRLSSLPLTYAGFIVLKCVSPRVPFLLWAQQ